MTYLTPDQRALLIEYLRRYDVRQRAGALEPISLPIFPVANNAFSDAWANPQYTTLVFKGGRGSGKSQFFTNQLIESSFDQQYAGGKFVIARETKIGTGGSVYDKVVRTIVDPKRDLGKYFDINSVRILNKRTGVRMVFRGLNINDGAAEKFKTIERLKAESGVRMFWLDEAAIASHDLLRTIYPTFQRDDTLHVFDEEGNIIFDDSEKPVRMLFSLNPILVKDAVVEYAETLGDQAKIIHCNITDLKPDFQSKLLMQQYLTDQQHNPIEFINTWLGQPSTMLGGFPFQNMREQGNVTCRVVAVMGAYLDVAVGGDDMALSFIGRSADDELCVWGHSWKNASWFDPCIIDNVLNLMNYNGNTNNFWYDATGGVGRSLIPTYTIRKNSKLTNMMPDWISTNKERRIYNAGVFLKTHAVIAVDRCNARWQNNVLNYNERSHKTQGADDAPDSLARLCDKLNLLKTDKVKL